MTFGTFLAENRAGGITLEDHLESPLQVLCDELCDKHHEKQEQPNCEALCLEQRRCRSKAADVHTRSVAGSYPARFNSAIMAAASPSLASTNSARRGIAIQSLSPDPKTAGGNRLFLQSPSGQSRAACHVACVVRVVRIFANAVLRLNGLPARRERWLDTLDTGKG